MDVVLLRSGSSDDAGKHGVSAAAEGGGAAASLADHTADPHRAGGRHVRAHTYMIHGNMSYIFLRC